MLAETLCTRQTGKVAGEDQIPSECIKAVDMPLLKKMVSTGRVDPKKVSVGDHDCVSGEIETVANRARKSGELCWHTATALNRLESVRDEGRHFELHWQHH